MSTSSATLTGPARKKWGVRGTLARARVLGLPHSMCAWESRFGKKKKEQHAAAKPTRPNVDLQVYLPLGGAGV